VTLVCIEEQTESRSGKKIGALVPLLSGGGAMAEEDRPIGIAACPLSEWLYHA
jgi:hypothetical protein